MFNFNNNKKENELPQLDLEELFQRLEHLERKCRRMDDRIKELEEQLAQIDVKKTNFDAKKAENSTLEPPSVAEIEVESVGINIDNAVEPTQTVETPASFAHTEVFYLAAPNPDGTFSQASSMEQIGKSIYQLTTSDGQNGTFILLDTPDAIATAMISVSQFVKPACKISGNTAIQPRHIITEEEGAASREGTGWKITRKAVVRFE